MAKKDTALTAPPGRSRREPNLQGVIAARELFWQNVIREMLTSLSVISSARGTPGSDQAAGEGEDNIFDGRLAVFTHLGQRVPIAAVSPLFACGINTSERDKQLSMAVECTVFQIQTPSGEVYTLPLHEIRGFHALTEDLMQQIRDASEEQAEGGEGEPFGFAAYTSLSRTRMPDQFTTAEPDEDPPPT